MISKKVMGLSLYRKLCLKPPIVSPFDNFFTSTADSSRPTVIRRPSSSNSCVDMIEKPIVIELDSDQWNIFRGVYWTLSNIVDGVFCKSSYWLEVANSILDVWQGTKVTANVSFPRHFLSQEKFVNGNILNGQNVFFIFLRSV